MRIFAFKLSFFFICCILIHLHGQQITYTPSVGDVNLFEKTKTSLIMGLLRYFEWKELKKSFYLLYYVGEENDILWNYLSETAKKTSINQLSVITKLIKRPEDIQEVPNAIIVGSSGANLFSSLKNKLPLSKSLVILDGSLSVMKEADIIMTFNSTQPNFLIKKNKIETKKILIADKLLSFKQVSIIE